MRSVMCYAMWCINDGLLQGAIKIVLCGALCGALFGVLCGALCSAICSAS